MKQYLESDAKVLDEGTQKNDRTGTARFPFFGHQMRFNLQEGFPLVTTKRCHIYVQLFTNCYGFCRAIPNIAYLHENNVTIWDLMGR